jgi:hypothetical protein
VERGAYAVAHIRADYRKTPFLGILLDSA